MLNLYKVQDHGATAHEAVGGKHCKTPICPFGENIQWKKQSEGTNSTKAESEWYDGVFLGVRPISGECIVGSSNGVVYCRTVRRVQNDDMWSMHSIRKIPDCVRDFVSSKYPGAQPGRRAQPQLVPRNDSDGIRRDKPAEATDNNGDIHGNVADDHIGNAEADSF